MILYFACYYLRVIIKIIIICAFCNVLSFSTDSSTMVIAFRTILGSENTNKMNCSYRMYKIFKIIGISVETIDRGKISEKFDANMLN